MIPDDTNKLPDEQRDWIEATLLDAGEGQASVSDIAVLRDLLAESEEARRIYLQFNQLDCHLSMASANPVDIAPPAADNFIQKLRPNHLVSALVGAGIAALITLVFTMSSRTDNDEITQSAIQPEMPLVSLYSEYDTQFSENNTLNLNDFEKGSMSLDRGIAQLNFRNGAQIVLEGKCGFEIIDEMTVVLTYGKIWAYCPPEAHGFKVITPGGREVIDLGTEFGIEVSYQGKTDVHVFDGLVNVVDPNNGIQEITAGKAYQWNSELAPPTKKGADYGKFITSTDLRNKRIRSHHAKMLKRDDLILYYDFVQISDNKVVNKALNAAESTHGKIHRASLASGRFTPRSALQFERRGSSVELELERPEDVRQFTMALWVNIDQLPSALSTLINSNGWESGDIHFQITRSGNLRTGLHGGRAYQTETHSIQAGQWHLLATTWDLDTQEAQLYCDGRKLISSRYTKSVQYQSKDRFQWGQCQIGSWKPLTTQLNDIRDFKGRIDEMMIFDHTLSDAQIAELYEYGKP
ncbi:MAG: LamG-like jellyroll fold domain-containing protein [Akkermansiaceae bacterium]